MRTQAVNAREQARQRNGEFGEQHHSRPELDDSETRELPVVDEADWEPERVWRRVETLCGEQLMLRMDRDTKPPVLLDGDTIQQGHRKLLAYARKTFDPTDHQAIADALGYPLAAEQVTLDARLLQAMRAKEDTQVITLEGDEKTGPILVVIKGAAGREGTWLIGQARDRMTFMNASSEIADKSLKQQFMSEYPELDPQDVTGLFDRLKTGKKADDWLWDEAEVDTELFYAATQGWTGEASTDITVQARILADHLDKQADREWIREGIERLPKEPGARTGPNGTEQFDCPVMRFSNGRFTGRRFLYPDRVGDELAGTSRRAQRARINRAYREFLKDRMNQETDRAATLAYIHDAAKHNATVYQEKKHTPDSHVAAARQSVFRASGDFAHVELDESVDLPTLREVEDDYRSLRRVLPVTTAPTLRFRKTGRHQAIGVYHPHADNIAVDPRAPRSFVHEYCHHLDFTAGEKPLSMRQPWIRAVQDRVRSDPAFTSMGRSVDYWATPTEILARSGEMYLEWKGVQTSLNAAPEDHENPAYTTLAPVKADIIAFWDRVFAENDGAH
jgi:hypothetical protein